MKTLKTGIEMKAIQRYPRTGNRVEGTHIFGAKYIGTIWESRPHSMEPERTVCFINFDSPVEICKGDIRTSICVEVYPPSFNGDLLFQSGHGDLFKIITQ